jgi:serine protease
VKSYRLRLLAGLLLLGVIPALLLFARTSAEERGTFTPHPGTQVESGELVVEFRSDVPASHRTAVLSAHGVTLEREMLLDDYVVVNVPPSRRAALGEALATSDAVATVEEVPARYPASIPNDPAYDSQWHLEYIKVEQAYDITDGSGVIVAVVDTGVAFENYTDASGQFAQAPDLAEAGYVHPWDAFAQDVHPNDDFGHGTHVAGTIAQKTNNGIGAAGVAPGVQIMPIKVCGWNTSVNPPAYNCPSSDLAEGIRWAVDHGARVINLSLGARGPTCANATALEREALQYANDAGVIVIGASGNEGFGVLCFPASVPSVVSVGAIAKDLDLASYSNHGANSIGENMDLVGPGGDPILDEGGDGSLIFQQTYGNCFLHQQSYTTFEITACAGTSMAAAHVSGVAALVRAQFPHLNVTQVKENLEACALDLGVLGEDPFFGHGLVQAQTSIRDLDADNIPDCIDPITVTPSPTPVPPPNDCSNAPSPTAFPTATPTDPPTPTPSPSVTPEPTITDTPSPAATGSPTTAPSDTGAPGTETPTETPTATAEPTPTPTPTATPVPTPSPSPSPTPEPGCGDVDCSGEVNAMDSLGVTRWLAQVAPFADCLGKGYVTCDALLDMNDTLAILRYSGGLPLSQPLGCSGIE